MDPLYRATRALILVPTRELSEQVHSCLRSLLAYCDKDIAVSNVASGAASHVQRCGWTTCELTSSSRTAVASYWRTSRTLSLRLRLAYWDFSNPRYVENFVFEVHVAPISRPSFCPLWSLWSLMKPILYCRMAMTKTSARYSAEAIYLRFINLS